MKGDLVVPGDILVVITEGMPLTVDAAHCDAVHRTVPHSKKLFGPRYQ